MHKSAVNELKSIVIGSCYKEYQYPWQYEIAAGLQFLQKKSCIILGLLVTLSVSMSPPGNPIMILLISGTKDHLGPSGPCILSGKEWC